MITHVSKRAVQLTPRTMRLLLVAITTLLATLFAVDAKAANVVSNSNSTSWTVQDAAKSAPASALRTVC